MIEMEAADIKTKCRAIVCFGPATEKTGLRAGEFFQVTLDPTKVSPGGLFIRFDHQCEDEIHGWQRIAGMTICEILGEYSDESLYPPADGKPEPLVMMKIKQVKGDAVAAVATP